MKYAFWNTHNKENINTYLQGFIDEYRPDVLALAEYKADGKRLENFLRKNGLPYTFIPRIASRLDIFYIGNSKKVTHCSESKYYTIKILPYGKERQIISVVHFPSKMYQDDAGNEEILRDMLSDINRIRQNKKIKNIVMVGDFNMNPFESPMISATALQAISSREIVIRRGERVYKEKDREFFYNPMWNFLGDARNPVGSYYYKSPQNEALYWNTFDQFIVNKELADDIDLNKIKFVTSLGTIKLGNERGEPVVSDHFPLYFEIGEEK